MTEATLEHVFINVSKRQVTLLADDGTDQIIEWKWDREGSEGFSETVDALSNVVDSDSITYSFATL